MCYDKAHLVLDFGQDIMHNFEENQNFQISAQKKCSAYEAKLFNGANSQPAINIVKAFGVDIHIACIRLHISQLG